MAEKVFGQYIDDDLYGANTFWDNQFKNLYTNTPIENQHFIDLLEDEAELAKSVNTSLIPFSGSNAKVPSNNSLNITDGITIQFWAKSNNIKPITGRLVNKGGDFQQDGYSINITPNTVHFELFNSDRSEHGWARANITNIDFTSWHLITGTWDSSSGDMTIYVDSVPVAKDKFSGPIGLNSLPLSFGKSPTRDWHSNACLANIGLWDFPLTPDQIAIFHTADPFANDLIKVAVGFWIANSKKGNFTGLTNKDLNAIFVSGEIKSATRRFGENNEFAIFRNLGANEDLKMNFKRGDFQKTINDLDSIKFRNKKFNKDNEEYLARNSVEDLILLAVCYLELGDRKTSDRLLQKYDEAQKTVSSGPNFRQQTIAKAFAEYCRQK